MPNLHSQTPQITVTEWGRNHGLSPKRALEKRADFYPPPEEKIIGSRTYYMVDENAILRRFRPWGRGVKGVLP